MYVSPWPSPEAERLPELPEGAFWHTAGFVGAVLRGSELLAAADGAVQAARFRSFVFAAIEASRSALGPI